MGAANYVWSLLSLMAVVMVNAKPDVAHLPHAGRQISSGYSTLVDPIAFPKVTPPPHPAGKIISDLIGTCSCPAMKTNCDAIVVYRQNTKIVKVPGERRTVYLNKERLQEIPIREPVVLDKDFVDPQRVPARIVPQPVEVTREVLREQIEYYDLIVDRIEIQYNDVVQKVILEVEEPDVVEEIVDEPVRVQLREEALNIIDQPEKIWLNEEFAQQHNETIRVKQNVYDIRSVVQERTEVIPCDNYRIVKIPRDDCNQPRINNGYLPAP